ncbi:hypothetical protein GCM10009087_03290 [Sphingomonas oligophenolica]|uniref:Uncharacterized protein n=1 Tax=Sphingomonas oligophenolica TaxID=301154 RepID=A0ABU9Y0H2_9SPHN
MTKDTDAAPGCDPAVPGAMLFPMFPLWEMPMAFGTAWWNAITAYYWPPSPMERRAAHHLVHHEPHHQLVVPDPIEEEGERALLA